LNGRCQKAHLFRFFDNGFERGVFIRAEAGDRIVIDGDCVLAAAELAERNSLVDKRPCNLLAQGQFARRAEAGDHIVIDGDCVLIAAEPAEPDPFVAERPRDLFAQGQFARAPKRAITSS
jgi:sulfur transfer complex TusBCD TusB component (DsrH family)